MEELPKDVLAGESGMSAWEGFLDAAPDLPLLAESVEGLEGQTFWHAPSKQQKTFKLAEMEGQLAECVHWAESEKTKDTQVSKDLVHIPLQLQACGRAWTRDLCYPITNMMRMKGRSVADTTPAQPYLKQLLRFLHQLPEDYIVRKDLYRAENGVRSTWDTKVLVGNVLEYFEPRSFSSDPKVLQEFKNKDGDRTLTIIKQGWGYDLSKISYYGAESEVLTEPTMRLRIIRCEKFDKDHYLVIGGEVKEGLHVIEAVQVQGIELLSGSPVRRKEREAAEAAEAERKAAEATDHDSEQAALLFVGNPGAGKSTLANCLAKKVIFKAGVGIGTGVTYALAVEKAGGITYIDTPGLSDEKRRHQAGVEISKALKRGGPHRIIFVVQEHSGRILADDKTTISLVLKAAPEISNNYGVVVNQVGKKVLKKLADVSTLQDWKAIFFQDIEHVTSAMFFNERVEELADEDDAVVDLEPALVEFLNSVPIVNLTKDAAEDIDSDAFNLVKEMLEREREQSAKEREELLQKMKDADEAQKQYADELKALRKLQEVQAQKHEEALKVQERERKKFQEERQKRDEALAQKNEEVAKLLERLQEEAERRRKQEEEAERQHKQEEEAERQHKQEEEVERRRKLEAVDILAKAAGEWVEDNSMRSGESAGLQQLAHFVGGWSWMAATAAAQLFTVRIVAKNEGEGAFVIDLIFGFGALWRNKNKKTFKGNVLTGKAESKLGEDEAKKIAEAGSDSEAKKGSIQNVTFIESCELEDSALVLHGYFMEDTGKTTRKDSMKVREDGKLNWTIELSREKPAEGHTKDVMLKFVFCKA